jgi:hypothetical protein
MGSTAAAISATSSVFRGHVAPEWDSGLEPDSQSVITRPGLPLSRSFVIRIDSPSDLMTTPELGAQTPFAYRFAQPITGIVDPRTLPQMGSHFSRVFWVYYGNTSYIVYGYGAD